MSELYDIYADKFSGEDLQIFNHVQWGIVISNGDSKSYSRVNPAYAKMHGYSVDEMIGMDIEDIYVPEKRPELLENIRVADRDGYSSFESMHQKKDGNRFPVQVDITAVKNETGELLYRVGNVIDMSGRKETIADLEKSSERYHTILENSPDLIFVVDRDDAVIYINKSCATFFGKTKQEMKGQPRINLFPDYVKKDPGNGIKKAFNTGESLLTETMLDFPNGQICLENKIVPLYNETGTVYAVMGISRDITRRKNLEAFILNEKELFASIINSLPGIFYMIGPDRKFLQWNKNFEMVIGYTQEEISKGYPEEFFNPQDKELVIKRIEEVFAKGEASSFESELMTKDNKYIPYLLSRAVIEINDKPCLVGIGVDITSRKEAEEELAQKTEALTRSNNELERFAYVASHDLQEPLRMVTSYLQLLVRRYRDKLDGDALEFIDYAVDGSNRMKLLINDLLTYSRVNTVTKEFEPRELDVILERALNNLQLKIEENQAEITHDALPVVKVDDAQLLSLFQNLIENAIKYRGEETPRIHIGVDEKENEWQFSVKDNGIGIEPEYFERVFIIFQRLHTIRDYSGTGIGLAVSKRIVERHAGRIWVESKPGEGSTFYFTLPKIRKE